MRRPVSVWISSCTRLTPASKAFAKCPAQHRGTVEDLPCLQAQDVVALNVQKAMRSFRNQHRPSIPCEQQDAVLQVPENLVEVLFQGRENLLHIPHALPDLFDFRRDPFGSIEPGQLASLGSTLHRRRIPVIELHADLFQGP